MVDLESRCIYSSLYKPLELPGMSREGPCFGHYILWLSGHLKHLKVFSGAQRANTPDPQGSCSWVPPCPGTMATPSATHG